jgi:uncharacterized membrane protein (DUF106 family)
MSFFDILDPVLGPLLTMNPALAILLVSGITSLVITILYKYMTDQVLIKSIKDEQKKMRKDIQKHADDPKKMMEINSKMMSKSMVLMKQTLRPSLITMIPILLIFGWLNANFAYYPISPGEEFSIDAFINADTATLEILPSDRITFLTNQTIAASQDRATWNLVGEAGTYTMRVHTDKGQVEQELIIGTKYATPDVRHRGDIRRVVISNEKLKVNVAGISMGWIWAYILFSIVGSIAFRKLFRVH